MDRVLVQRIKAAERTASGLFIPEKVFSFDKRLKKRLTKQKL
jgi:co-chaperonin GroES (HSP10)